METLNRREEFISALTRLAIVMYCIVQLLAIVALAFNVGCTFFLSSASTDCYVHALERLRLGIVTCLRTNKSLLICTWRSWTARNASASESYAYMLALIEALLPGECVLVELILCISSHGI